MLEDSDDLRNLAEIGLNPEDNGLFGAVPEAVTRLIFSNYICYWISIAYNNSYMMEFFLPDCAWSRKYSELQWFVKRWSCEDLRIKRQKAIRKKVA